MKKLKTLLLTSLLTISFMSFSAMADDLVTEEPNIKITIDGKTSIYSSTPITKSGSTLLPLREILINLGIPNDAEHIIWNSTENSITIYNDSTKVFLKIEDNNAKVNGNNVILDVAPTIYKEKTYIPVRFVSHSFGKKVSWDEATSTVFINSDEQQSNKQADSASKVEPTPAPAQAPTSSSLPDSWTVKRNKPDINVKRPFIMKGTGITLTNYSDDMNKAVTIGNKIYMIHDDGKVKDYDPSSDSWTDFGNIPALKDSMGFFKVVTISNKIYIIGVNLSDIIEYDPSTNQSILKTKLQEPRMIGAAVAVDGNIYVLGGLSKSTVTTVDSFDMYNPSTDIWTKKKSINEAVNQYSVTSLNGKIYILGANTKDGGHVFEGYDIESDSWTSKAPLTSSRTRAALETVNGKIYVIGKGMIVSNKKPYTSYINNVEEYDPATNKWTVRADMPTSRSGFATSVFNGEVYVIDKTSVEKYTPPDPSINSDGQSSKQTPSPSETPTSDSQQTDDRIPLSREDLKFLGQKDLIESQKVSFTEDSIFSMSKAVTGNRSGKYYFELVIGVGASRTAAWTNAGIATAEAQNFLSRRADDFTGYAYGIIDAFGKGFFKPTDLKSGDVIGIAMDLDNGRLYASLNGEWTKGTPGNDIGGISIAKDKEYFAGVSCGKPQKDSINSDTWTANFGTTKFSYKIPDGYATYNGN